MKAVTCTKYGPPEVLKFVEIEKPIPAKHEVLIKVKATTVTVADHRIRSFDVPKILWLPVKIALGWRKPKHPILGVELAGEIEQVGKEVTKYQKGDQVFGSTFKDFGGYAEYKCLPEDAPITKKPSGLSFEEAAAMPVGARTALQYIQGNIKSGQEILIYGASGSVGTYAVQLAKYFGAEVTAVCSQPNFELVKSLGATKAIDYSSKSFPNTLGKYDMILIAVDKWPFSSCHRYLKKEGIYANVTYPLQSLHMIWTRLTSKKRILMGKDTGETTEILDFLKRLVEAGHLKPVIDRSYKFDEIVEAHRYVDKGHKKGNVAITVS